MNLGSHAWRHVCRCLSVLAFLVAAAVQAKDEYLITSATVEGKPVQLIFDTGASHMLLFRSSAERLGFKVIPSNRTQPLAPGAVPFDWTEELRITLGKIESRTAFAVVDVPRELRIPVDGCIGWGAVRHNILWIDAEKGRIEGLKEIPPEVQGWTRFAIKNAKFSVLVLEASDLPGKPCFLIDTGAGDGLHLHPKKWREWREAHPGVPATVDAYYTPGCGLVVSEVAWADEFPLGPVKLAGIPLLEANSAEMAMTGEGYEATLGMVALQRLDLVVDGAHNVAYLRPKATPRPEYNHNRLGAVFVPADLAHEALVGHVAAGSPAFEAGIRDGDELLKIDDLDVTRWRTDPRILPMGRFWERPAGTKVKLTLKRGQEIFVKEVELRSILAPRPRTP